MLFAPNMTQNIFFTLIEAYSLMGWGISLDLFLVNLWWSGVGQGTSLVRMGRNSIRFINFEFSILSAV